jgi:hypothetical protein
MPYGHFVDISIFGIQHDAGVGIIATFTPVALARFHTSFSEADAVRNP